MKTLLKTIICALITGVLAVAVFAGVLYINNVRKNKAIEAALKKQQEVYESLSYENGYPDPTDTVVYDVSGAAGCAMPALVSVSVTQVSKTLDFFGRQYSYESKGNASGIIAAQNYGELLIVTNNHVVSDISSVSVTFIDGTTVNAEVRSTEESEDLAVISVLLNDIPAETLAAIRIATFGNSDDLVPGEMVIAIGNALGYGQSVTVGYVSALNREVKMDDYTLSLIQTDVAINPGNSGGALLNSRGEIVGINNAKIASSSVEGICYAIPTSTAIPIIDELMTRVALPESKQACLGIVGQVITAENASLYKMPRGIYVKEVKNNSAAEAAGIRAGYIITAVNGKTVYSQERYEKIFSYTQGGSEGTVTVKKLVEGEYVEEVINITFGYKGEN